MKNILLLYLFIIPYALWGQDMSVRSFKMLPADMDAKIHHKVIDQNDEVCALVKVQTTAKGFVFETGSLGIAKVVEKTGEVWVYLPHGARFLTIKHDQLGVIRNYEYPTGLLKKATVYEMVLTTAKITMIVEEKLPQFGSIDSDPSGADVYINGERKGTTPIASISLIEGVQEVKITKPLYYDYEGSFTVVLDQKFNEKFTLKPNFGGIRIESLPESGADITLDGQPLNQKTPYSLAQLPSGNHTLRLSLDMYDVAEQSFILSDGASRTLSLHLKPLFGNLTITTTPSADIYIDNQKVATASTTWQGRLLQGIHGIQIKKAKYYEEQKSYTMQIGADETLDFTLLPITGTLAIESTPISAQVTVDGEQKGISPLYVRNLIIGTHTVKISKEGYATIEKTITITENQTLQLNETLDSQKTIYLTSNPNASSVYIDNNYEGTTPLNITLTYGKTHEVKLTNAGYADKTLSLNAETATTSRHLTLTSNPSDETTLRWYNKGYNYNYGIGGLPNDYIQAVYWYKKAAEQGHAKGQTDLGYMYSNGFGVTRDYEKAVYWYRKAAEQGHAHGQTNLGYMYFNGYGVTKDYEKAIYWWKKACNKGYQTACSYLKDNGLD